MNPNIPSLPTPRNTQDLRRIMEQYGALISPENLSLITEVIQHVERGADIGSLQNLLAKVQNRTRSQQTQAQRAQVGGQHPSLPPRPRLARLGHARRAAQQGPTYRHGQAAAGQQAMPQNKRPAPGQRPLQQGYYPPQTHQTMQQGYYPPQTRQPLQQGHYPPQARQPMPGPPAGSRWR